MSTPTQVSCSRCARLFLPRFRFQTEQLQGQPQYFCSQTCRDPTDVGEEVACGRCGKVFVPTLALHVAAETQGLRYFCSLNCRTPTPSVTSATKLTIPTRVLAVLNQKGGTAKTTTALSVAAGFALLGHKTLLIDLDPQGNIAVSLGLNSRCGIGPVLLEGKNPEHCWINARPNLDVITSDENLSLTEIALAQQKNKNLAFCLQQGMKQLDGYDYVVLDCAPALSLLNQNALVYAKEVLIPVSCDYLSLVGVQQVLGTLRRITEQTAIAVRVAGVLPTFFDVRNRLSLEALTYLRKTYGAKALPPIRVNTKLAEAPSLKKTIFEHAPDSHGARDYMRVVEWLRTSAKSCIQAA